MRDSDYLERRYAKNPSMVSRRIADEFILVPIRHNVGDLDSIYTLNEVGARIWELIDGNNSVREIRDRIVEEYEVDPQIAEQDMTELVTQLEAIDAILEIEQKSGVRNL